MCSSVPNQRRQAGTAVRTPSRCSSASMMSTFSKKAAYSSSVGRTTRCPATSTLDSFAVRPISHACMSVCSSAPLSPHAACGRPQLLPVLVSGADWLYWLCWLCWCVRSDGWPSNVYLVSRLQVQAGHGRECRRFLDSGLIFPNGGGCRVV